MENEILRCMAYDTESGIVSWKAKLTKHAWKARVGKPIGSLDKHGYLNVNFNGRVMFIHRIAWLLHHGTWPTGDIDHVNGCKTDNRVTNLRECTRRQGNHNKGITSRNSSGFRGVSWDAGKKKWAAQIKVNGKNKSLGRFNDPAAASRAYEAAASDVHGDFYKPTI